MTEPTIDPTLPEVVRRFLAAGARLESIRLDASGVWWHEGGRVENPRVAALFSRSVNRTPGGTWVLEIAPFTYPIEVEDTPLFVEKIASDRDDPGHPDERLTLTLSDATTEALIPDSLAYDALRGMTCAVKGGRFEARFKRPAFHALADRLEEIEGGFALRVAGRAIPLVPTPTP